jgi:hypothetical protein
VALVVWALTRGEGEKRGRDDNRRLFSKQTARWRGPREGKKEGRRGPVRVREEAGDGGEGDPGTAVGSGPRPSGAGSVVVTE